MKRVLLTGATGFIGRHCIPFLQQKGYEVFALSSKPQSDNADLTWLECDLLHPTTLEHCLTVAKPTHLLHLAWNATPGKFWHALDNLDWVKAGLHLVQRFAEQGGKRIVMAGTCAEYDWSSSEFSESTTPCRPQALYGICKLALHQMVAAYAAQMQISQASGRIFYLYGPHEYPQRLIPAIIGGLLKNEPISCSSCTQVRDFMHVADVADAFVTLLDSPLQGAINIGSGKGVMLKEMIEIITDALGKAELVQFGAFATQPNDPPQLIAKTDRLQRELNWSPKYDLREGLHQVMKWWEVQLCRINEAPDGF